MKRVALRGLLSRKLRTALTAIAIVLGVSMISGTYVLTDTINQSFSQIFQQANRNIDAILTGKQRAESRFSLPPPLPGRVLTIVRGTGGVAAAEGEVADMAQLVGPDGEMIGGKTGPSLLFSVPSARFRSSTIVAGHEPGAHQIALDGDTIARYHLRLREVLRVAGQAQAEPFTLAGSIKFGSVGSIGGATLIEMPLGDAQRITHKAGVYDEIVVAAAPGVSQTELVRRLRAAIPPSLRGRISVQTGQQHAVTQTDAIGKALNFLTVGLLAFGGVAVFVGAFIIFNTFSITVAQRTREFGLLRTLGATRAQVLRVVLLEAAIIGLGASILGLVGGIGIARLLNSLFLAIGIDLPNTGLVVARRTLVVGLAVGTLVTLASSLFPAFRATRVSPIAALREGAQLPRQPWSRYLPAAAVAVLLLAAGLLAYGVFGAIVTTQRRLILLGLGSGLVFIGMAMLSPQLVRPLALVVGWPMERATSITGRLARENTVRAPGRTAVTAAALMIGLALVGFVTIFAAELRQTASDTIDRELAGNIEVYNDNGGLIPSGLAGTILRIPGVAAASALKADAARVEGTGNIEINGIQADSVARVYRFHWTAPPAEALSALKPYQVLIDDNFARNHHLSVGRTLAMTTPAGGRYTFTIIGVYTNTGILPNISLRYDVLDRLWEQRQDRLVIVTAQTGADLKALKTRIDRTLQARYPTATAHSQQDLKDQVNTGVNQLLGLIYALLALSVIVSLVGIINTLVLSVYERTREIGMLRAIGTSRSQVRWIIRGESIITAVIGSILGLAVGTAFAYLITAGLANQGIEYALPLGQLAIFLVLTVVLGMVAAAFPARRASRLDVLTALAYE